MKTVIRIVIASALAALLTACFTKEPAEQCLDSFRSTLKDPDSGKVVEFKDKVLTYTATNSYGARIQGKALCQESVVKKGEWSRDTSGEYSQILNLAATKLEKSNECRSKGGKAAECAGNSRVLQRAAISLSAVNLKDLEDEAARELGY